MSGGLRCLPVRRVLIGPAELGAPPVNGMTEALHEDVVDALIKDGNPSIQIAVVLQVQVVNLALGDIFQCLVQATHSLLDLTEQS